MRKLLNVVKKISLTVSTIVLLTLLIFPTGAYAEEDQFIETLAKDTWNYLRTFKENHLPYNWHRVDTDENGKYCNPAEIGFYILSYIGAYEMQEDWSPSWQEVSSEVIATLDQLEAWQNSAKNSYNGLFYQWYWVVERTVGQSPGDQHVPSVDNAWLAASLITIREYVKVNGHLANANTIRSKCNNILKRLDFKQWYNPTTHRFYWGDYHNPQGGGECDYYSNENRIINYVARILGQLNKEEFQSSLNALVQQSGTYKDITVEKVNWDGSYFTYVAPALFVKEMETSYGINTIDKATKAQIVYAADKGYPVWGISDCFGVKDSGYVERGAPPRGSNNDNEDLDDGLITPHASVMALITSYRIEAITNLQKLRANYPDLYDDNYGFKDSVNVNTNEISYRFCTLDQEWIFLSLVNYQKGTIWKYFKGNRN